MMDDVSDGKTRSRAGVLVDGRIFAGRYHMIRCIGVRGMGAFRIERVVLELEALDLKAGAS